MTAIPTSLDDRPTVAIWPWGNVVEDWLDPLRLGVDDLLDKMDDGWLFGYVRALQSAGIRPVLLCVTTAVAEPERRVHQGTAADTWLVPPPTTLRLLRVLKDPYASSARAALGTGLWRRLLGLPVWLLSPYLSTPLVRVIRLLKQERISALLCQEYEEGRFDLAVAACRLAGIRVFATYQGGAHCRTLLERFVRPRSVRAADGLLIGAEVERNRVREAYTPRAERLHAIANPVASPTSHAITRSEARATLGLEKDDLVAVYVGRVELWPKGLDVLVAAWAECCAARPGAPLRLLLLGSGSDSPRLRAILEASAIPNVLWRDEYVLDRSLVWTYLAAADVYVHPARHEGFAVAPMEAMAAGLPVVAADAPGIVDLLGPENLGTVVPRDDPEALALAMGSVLDDIDGARTAGARAQVSVLRRFGIDRIGAQLASALLPWSARVPRAPSRPGMHGIETKGRFVPPRAPARGLPVSVVVPTVGRPVLLKQCLDSILCCHPGPGEIVVVDQSGADAATDVIASLGDPANVRVVRDDGRGIARATNMGVAAAFYPTVFVTHDDCTVSGDWIAVGARLLDGYPGALLTGRVLPPDGSPYVPSTIDDAAPLDLTGTIAAGRLYPANMVLDREEFLTFGGFDERDGFRLAAEDNDLCFRWLAAGRSLRYEPELIVWHHDWRTSDELVRTHITYAHGQGAFYAKHLFAGDRRVLRLLQWDLTHGFAAPLRAVMKSKPRWQEPYFEMNFSLLSGIVRALPEAFVLARRSPTPARPVSHALRT